MHDFQALFVRNDALHVLEYSFGGVNVLGCGFVELQENLNAFVYTIRSSNYFFSIFFFFTLWFLLYTLDLIIRPFTLNAKMKRMNKWSAILDSSLTHNHNRLLLLHGLVEYIWSMCVCPSIGKYSILLLILNISLFWKCFWNPFEVCV